MLTIGEFSKISRVSKKALRYYDQIGLIKPGYVNSDSGYRYYEVSQLRTMLLISRLKQYQFSLPEIAAVISKNDDNYLRELILSKKSELKSHISNQQALLKQMEQDIEKIERCENFMHTEYLVKTVVFEPINIYSIRKKMSLKDFSEAFGELSAGLGKNRLKQAGPFLSLYHDEDFNPDYTDIEVGAVVSDSKGDGVRRLDPGLCCFTTRIGAYDDFSPCYAALAEWVEQEGYVISGPAIELYIKGYGNNVSPDEYVTEIYYPIKKK